MKYTFLAATLIAISFQAKAQDEETVTLPKPEKNYRQEVGIFGQTPLGSSSSPTTTLAGVQYMKWVKPNLGYRVLAAFGDYNNNTNPPYQMVGSIDTVFSNRLRTHISYGYIGGGFVAQRHFYKRVHLYAAVDMRVGYGNGLLDTLKEKQYREAGSNYFTTNYTTTGASANVNSFNLAITPSIGGRLQFRRLVIGAEILPGSMSYQTFSYENAPANNSTEFNMGDVSQRFYIHFRF